MNVDIWEAILWGAVGGAAWTIPSWVRFKLRDRRRQKERERRTEDYLVAEREGR